MEMWEERAPQLLDKKCNAASKYWSVAFFAVAGLSVLFTTPAFQLHHSVSKTTSAVFKGTRLQTPVLSHVAPPMLFIKQDSLPKQKDNHLVSHPHSTHMTASLLGGCFTLVGIAFAFIQKMAALKREGLALFPMTGLKGLDDDADEEIFTVNNLRAAPGSRHRKKRKGRGYAAGQGGSCGFGMRGQKSRKGRSVRPGFEGGQTPLTRRLPKLRGRPLGARHKRTVYQIVSIAKLVGEAQGAVVQFDDLSGAKPVLFKIGGLKKHQTAILPSGLTVKAHAFTKSARAAIEEAGGMCIVIDKYSRELGAEGKVVEAPEEMAMASFSGETGAQSGDVAMFAAMAVRSAKVGKYKEPKLLSSKLSTKKKTVIDQVHTLLMNSCLVFGFSTQGITVVQISALRKALPAGVKIRVVKNTLFRIASRGTGFEALDPLTMGAKMWAFVPEESMQEAVRVYVAFIKEIKKEDTNPIVGGVTHAELMSKEEVYEIGDLPTKEVMIYRLYCLLASIPERFIEVLKAVEKEKLEEEEKLGKTLEEVMEEWEMLEEEKELEEGETLQEEKRLEV